MMMNQIGVRTGDPGANLPLTRHSQDQDRGRQLLGHVTLAPHQTHRVRRDLVFGFLTSSQEPLEVATDTQTRARSKRTPRRLSRINYRKYVQVVWGASARARVGSVL